MNCHDDNGQSQNLRPVESPPTMVRSLPMRTSAKVMQAEVGNCLGLRGCLLLLLAPSLLHGTRGPPDNQVTIPAQRTSGSSNGSA